MEFSKRSDLVTGVGLSALAIYVYLESSAMPQVKRGLGPGGYPKFVAVGLLVLGAVLVVQSLFEYLAGKKVIFNIPTSAAARVAIFAAMIFAYTYLLQPVGFIPSSIAFLLAGTYFFGYRKHVWNVVFSLALTFFIYVIFRHVFLVLLPMGYWYPY